MANAKVAESSRSMMMKTTSSNLLGEPTAPALRMVTVIPANIEGREREAQQEFINYEEDCIFIPRDLKRLLILFGGHAGQFSLINKFRTFDGSVLAIRDPMNSWYQHNSNPLPDLAQAVGAFVDQAGFGKVVVAGDSAGGYAALYTTPFIPRAVCLALSPQTFQITENTNVRLASGGSLLRSTGAIINLRDHLTSHQSGAKFVVTGLSETKNEPRYFWGDHFHAANLMGVPNVEILLCEQHHHPVIWYLDPTPAMNFLFEHHDQCRLNIAEVSAAFGKALRFFN